MCTAAGRAGGSAGKGSAKEVVRLSPNEGENLFSEDKAFRVRTPSGTCSRLTWLFFAKSPCEIADSVL